MFIIKSFFKIIIKVIKDYALFAIIFSLIMIWIRYKFRKKDSIRYFLYYLYVFLIYSITIFDRILQERVVTMDYIGVIQLFENAWYIVSFVENVIMFIIFGILYMLAFKNENAIKQNIICAFIISLSIEVLQGIFHLGEAQIIDIIANVMGAWIGGMCIEKFRLYKERKDRRDGIG